MREGRGTDNTRRKQSRKGATVKRVEKVVLNQEQALDQRHKKTEKSLVC